MIQEKTVIEKIGGMGAITAAVAIFYAKVLADDTIKHFFKFTEMQAQAGKQKAFLAYAFGAPMAYTGKSLRAAHSHMNLTEENFNAVGSNFAATLKKLNVPQNLIYAVVVLVMTIKNDVQWC